MADSSAYGSTCMLTYSSPIFSLTCLLCSLYLYLSISLYLTLSVSLTLSLTTCLSLILFDSPTFFFYLFLSLPLHLSPSLFLSFASAILRYFKSFLICIHPVTLPQVTDLVRALTTKTVIWTLQLLLEMLLPLSVMSETQMRVKTVLIAIAEMEMPVNGKNRMPVHLERWTRITEIATTTTIVIAITTVILVSI